MLLVLKIKRVRLYIVEYAADKMIPFGPSTALVLTLVGTHEWSDAIVMDMYIILLVVLLWLTFITALPTALLNVHPCLVF